LIQDAAAIQVCGELAHEYLAAAGFEDMFLPVTSLHWMGAWPQDEAQCAALVSYGGTLAAIGGAVSVTTKSTHESYGIPTPNANAEGLRTTRMAIYMARHIRLNELPEFQAEADLIRRETRPIIDRVLEMGDGDAALGAVRALEAGALDIPWSPNRFVQSRVMPARDLDGYLRVYDPGEMVFDPDVAEIHTERLMRRAEAEGVPYDQNLAVTSVYEISEPLDRLFPFPWGPE
jgi:methylaspartate mutase epsilon subunit